MKNRKILILAIVLMVCLLPAAFADMESVEGTGVLSWTNYPDRPQNFNGTIAGNLSGTISLVSNTYYDTVCTAVGVTDAKVTAHFDTLGDCIGTYSGANVNQGQNSGHFILECDGEVQVSGSMFGVNTELGGINLNYNAFVITPTPGPKGDTGDTGATGADGKDGAPGVAGYTPVKGVNYFDGINGTNGINGTMPVKGVDYFDGINGTNGAKGIKGDKGDSIVGPPGADGKDGKDGICMNECGQAFENCNSKDFQSCSGNSVFGKDYRCKPGFGADTMCLVGGCTYTSISDSCKWGCTDGACTSRPTEDCTTNVDTYVCYGTYFSRFTDYTGKCKVDSGTDTACWLGYCQKTVTSIYCPLSHRCEIAIGKCKV